MYLVTAREMQEMDRRTIEEFGLPGRILMENAGRGAAAFLLAKFQDIASKKVGVAAGRGNNGGDGFVIARYLAQMGTTVTVYLFAQSDRVRGDAAANLRLLPPLNVQVIEIPDKVTFASHQTDMRQEDLWVDALLGTGLSAEVKGFFHEVIAFFNQLGKPIMAVDIPSGLHADTGQPCGVAIRAMATATFAHAKIGHMVLPGLEYTGALNVVDIGIPPYITEAVAPRHALLTPARIASYFPPRSLDAHKGNTGHVLLLAGSRGKTGAAAMTAMSALRAGAGLATVGVPSSLNNVMETLMLEAMTQPLPETPTAELAETALEPVLELLANKKCLAIGPGIGTHSQTRWLVKQVLSNCQVPVVLDADGLNCLAGDASLLKELDFPVILTPHPGEMARLTASTPSQVQKDRLGAARTFAEQHGVFVVLKGARSVIAHPDGSVCLNPTGNPGMASGGMGDVLTGIIAGLLAQGLPPSAAAHAGVYLHGAAADTLVSKVGPFGYTAAEVMNAVPGIIAQLLHHPSRQERSERAAPGLA